MTERPSNASGSSEASGAPDARQARSVLSRLIAPAGPLGIVRDSVNDTRRRESLKALVTELAMKDFAERSGEPSFAPVVVLIASYLEAENIEAVLEAIPPSVHGLDTSTLVVIDGGDDATEEIAEKNGATWVKLPVNLGQGVALRLGYDLAGRGGARYIVTLDADGQNDPSEIPEMLAPIVSGEADFVIASRRLGRDETTDLARKAGVRFYSWLLNRIIHQNLTDTSNGFRAFRIEVPKSVLLEQDQYQTAELIIAAAAAGFRFAECPTIWRPRASGYSKKGSNLAFGANYLRVILRTWLRERLK
jgi:glycosyltransferase involved in cell wall biosynthesis